MKKFTVGIISMFLLCFSSFSFAETGNAAIEGEKQGSSGFAIAVGVGAAAAIATMVGLVVAYSTKSHSVKTSGGQTH